MKSQTGETPLQSLTGLEALSTSMHVSSDDLSPLTNLRKLTAHIPRGENPMSVLTKLTSLYVHKFGGRLNSELLTSLRRLVAHDTDAFTGYQSIGLCYGKEEFEYDDESTWCPSVCDLYEGDLSQGQFHGKGTRPYFKEVPDSYSRRAKNSSRNIFCGIQEINRKEMKKRNFICYFDGEFKNGLPHGPGTYFFQDGSKWTGNWNKVKEKELL